jgi:hypothetical protein
MAITTRKSEHLIGEMPALTNGDATKKGIPKRSYSKRLLL